MSSGKINKPLVSRFRITLIDYAFSLIINIGYIIVTGIAEMIGNDSSQGGSFGAALIFVVVLTQMIINFTIMIPAFMIFIQTISKKQKVKFFAITNSIFVLISFFICLTKGIEVTTIFMILLTYIFSIWIYKKNVLCLYDYVEDKVNEDRQTITDNLRDKFPNTNFLPK